MWQWRAGALVPGVIDGSGRGSGWWLMAQYCSDASIQFKQTNTINHIFLFDLPIKNATNTHIYAISALLFQLVKYKKNSPARAAH
jgi:hypothetical protein